MRFLLVLILLFTTSITSASDKVLMKDKQAIANLLTSFHLYAAQADGDGYFSLMTDDAIFLGTDASERWSKKEFQRYAQPSFNQGKGWTYIAKERNISFTPQGDVAFFDEVLFNEKYGHCRGSGVTIKTQQGWKISQYNLAILLPNDIASDIAKQIKAYELKSSNNDGK